MRRLTTLLALAFLLAPSLLRAQTTGDPPLERGFRADAAFQLNDIDQVDLLRGALAIVLPVGQSFSAGGAVSYQLKLAYTSDVWDIWREDTCPLDPEPCPVDAAYPTNLSNAGFGWIFTLGMLLDASDPNYPTTGWRYISSDGAEHAFRETLHDGETPNSNVTYTRDGSYIRMIFNSPYRFVEMPDGTRHKFEQYDLTNHKWRLIRVEDPFGNYLSITYDTDAQGHPRWNIADGTGRTHQVLFDATSNQLITVKLAAFAGTQAQYDFSYMSTQIHRSCLDFNPGTSEYVTVPLLVQITQPDGSTFKMKEGTAPNEVPTYYRCCNDGNACSLGPDGGSAAPGAIRRLYLPSGGGLQWEYETYEYYWEEPFRCTFDVICPRPSSLRWAGVKTRKQISSAGAEIAGTTWQYTNVPNLGYSPSTDNPSHEYNPGLRPEERRMVVVAPDGNSTVHYFRAYPGTNAFIPPERERDYSLPYTRRIPDPLGGGRYLSVQSFQGAIGIDDDGDICAPEDLVQDPQTFEWICTGTKDPIRTAYRAYQLDESPTAGSTGFRHFNRHLSSERTVHAELTGSHSVTVTHSEFDGLGHFRQSVRTADFNSTPQRTTYTHYNPSSGTYPPVGSFTLPSLGAPWVLTTYDFETQNEGGVTGRQEYCFETNTGFLQKVRTLTSGTTRGASDLLAVFTRDAQGNRIREQHYGGDTQAIGTGNQCDPGFTLPAIDSLRVDHGYQSGSLRTSRYWDSQLGVPLSFYTLDLNLDANTGLPSAIFSSSTGTKDQGDYVEGVRTNITYDAMGRLTWEKPTTGNGAWVQYTYTNAAGTAPARVTVRQRTNGSETGAILAAREYEYDGQGRLAKEKQLLPGQSWPASGACTTQCNQRVTAYTGMGWKDSVSEWQSYNPATVYKTQYLTYDPFGRPGTIRPPDGSAHDITLVYTGVRKLERTVMIATSPGTESAAKTTEEYDGQGRLWKVTEPSGSGGADVTTAYTYDVGNRLKQASTISGVTQNRVFTYDGRGFLTAEQLPELGASGNGTATYSKYDARGHARRRQDGLHDLAYTFDRAERLTQVAQADGSGNPSTPVLTTLAYATTNSGSNKRNGKLETATSANPDATAASVVETYAYAGIGGRTSSRQTQLEGHTVTQAFTWNDLGLPASVGYPDTSLLNNTSQEPTRSVTYSYSNGFLTSIPSYAGAISYHANTMVNRIDHANLVKVDHTIDPTSMRRPRQITLTNANGSWTYGSYAYDGAGNIKAIGTDTYLYDKVSRLTSGSFSTASCGAKSQTAAHNPFGFMTSTTTTDWATQTFTEAAGGLYNRISPGTTNYDAAGNMLSWSTYSYTWNRLNQMLTANSGANHTFIYTADGERVSDRVGTTKTVTIRDLSNKVLRIYSYNGSAWSWSKDYVYRDGQLLATVEPPFASQVVKHMHLDHLGTPRRVTNSSRNIIATHEYYPFGMEACGTADSERMKFTGHERDQQGTPSVQTDDLDYLHARYYNPTIARFLSVDPGRDNNVQVPQSWNLYAYARGNPVQYVDPDGEAVLPAAALGAAIGGVMGFTGSVLAQAYQAGGSFSSINWRDAGAAAAGGAVSGALFGATMGLSALANAGLGTAILVGAGTNVVGNAVSRQIDSNPATTVLSGQDMAWDAVSGAAGGALGSKIQQSIRSALPQIEAQIASSSAGARFGDFGAAGAVRGHVEKAFALNLKADLAGSIFGAKLTNVVTPVARVYLQKPEERTFKLFKTVGPS